MGWCHEFGSSVKAGCDHPMVAGSSSCHCDICGFECFGQFGGCATVWANHAEVNTRISSRDEHGLAEDFEHTPPTGVALQPDLAHPSSRPRAAVGNARLATPSQAASLSDEVTRLEEEVFALRTELSQRDVRLRQLEMELHLRGIELRERSATLERLAPLRPEGGRGLQLDSVRAAVYDRLGAPAAATNGHQVEVDLTER